MNKIEETKKSKVSNLIALTRIFEEYDDFKEKIEEYVAYNGKAGLSDLSLVSKANVVFLAFKAKKFYRENKAVIDEINAYSDIVSFAEEACTKDEAGNKTNCLDDFYDYMIDNKAKVNDISLMLYQMSRLGVNNLIYDDRLNFTGKSYEACVTANKNFMIEYFANMEFMPTYREEYVKYRTTGSDYKIEILPEFEKKDIYINNIELDSTTLPSSLTIDDITARFAAANSYQKENSARVRKSVILSTTISDLKMQYIDTKQQIESLNDLTDKDEYLLALTDISLRLSRLKNLSRNYDDAIIDGTSKMTKENLAEEKRLYLQIKKSN